MAAPRDLDVQRARKFLRELGEAPFVAFVLRDGETKIYAKGLDDDKMRQLEKFVEELVDDS